LFWNGDIKNNLEGVLMKIKEELKKQIIILTKSFKNDPPIKQKTSPTRASEASVDEVVTPTSCRRSSRGLGRYAPDQIPTKQPPPLG